MQTTVAVFCAAFLTCGCLAQSRAELTTVGDGNLRTFLQNYLRDPANGIDATTQYSVARVQLNENKTPEIVVYLTGQWSCGSGGCAGLILEPMGRSYKVIDHLSLVRLPIYVLPAKSNGWHDIATLVAGGGILHAYWGIRKYNGKKYVWTSLRDQALAGPKLPKGVVAIPLEVEGNLLYEDNDTSSTQ